VLCAVDKRMGFPFLLCSPGNSFPLCIWQACNLGKKRVFSPAQLQFSGVDNTVSCQGILFQNNSFTTPKTSLQQQDVRRMSSLHAGSNWTSLDRCGGALQRSNWISHTWSQINKAPLHQGCTKKAVAVASCQWKFSSIFFVNHLLLSFVVPEKSKKLFKSVCSRSFEDGILKEFLMHFVLLLLFSTFCMNLV
jgi:hypothetical protein